MSAFVSSSQTDVPPRGCVICGVECGWGVLCREHQGVYALAAWVDEGMMGDWDPDVGAVEPLNHRTMLIHPPVGASGAFSGIGWRDQLAVIVRRFGRWVGLDGEPPDPWVECGGAGEE